MKALTKITILAVLAALAVFSCAPEAELTDVDWKAVNSGYNSGKNSSYSTVVTQFSVASGLATGAGEANEVTITFPARSDFLRTTSDKKIESGIKQFLSFHHFTKLEIPEVGRADTLDTAKLDYNLVRRDANTVTVKLTKTFAITDSTVIMKIDGTKYTFASGNKLDLIGKGQSGQAGYDDIFYELPVSTVTGPSGFTGPRWFSGQGRGFNQGWTLTLDTISAPPSDGIEAAEYRIARLVLTGRPVGISEEVSAITKSVAEGLTSGLKVHEFTNGKWNPTNATVGFLVDESNSREAIFYVLPLTLKDFTPIRVMWERSGPVTTTADYFGVKQYIAVIGGINTPNEGNTARYRTPKVYGTPGIWYNDESWIFRADRYITDILVSQDNRHQNVAFDVVFKPVTSEVTGYTYWLKSFNNNKQKFKDNFKIAYYANGGGSVSNFTTRNDLMYVTIKDVEYFTYNPDDDEDIGPSDLNAIRITLDPAFESKDRQLYFYISPEIRFEDERTVFGDPANYMYGFFKAYIPEVYAPEGILLRNGVWVDGNLPTWDDIDIYYFPVTQGTTYRVWSNDGYAGNGTKTGEPAIFADYEDAAATDPWIFTSDEAWTVPQSFTADRTGFVILYVIAYYELGTYGICYSTGSTRPAVNY
jgi:hypothetical protein